MHPPQHTLDALYDIDPEVRLGFSGRCPPEKGMDPSGRFALILLVKPQYTENVHFADYWFDRGPIYGKPFDPISRVPMVVGWFDPKDVFGTRILHDAKHRKDAVVPHMIADIRATEVEANESMNETSEAASDYITWKANRTDRTSPEPVPYKHLTQEEKDVLSGDHPSQAPISFEDEIPK